jgi:hypothetical protein
MEDVMEFIASQTPNKDYVIDQLISLGSGYGLAVGRTSLGKTNLLLNLGFHLALGIPFLGMPTKKSRVGYFGFEGDEDNLRNRASRIVMRGLIPDKGWFQVGRIDSLIVVKNKDVFRKMITPFDIVMFDPIKWMVGGDYTQPKAVSEFTKVITEILRQEGKIAIFSVQIRKPDPRLKIEPGDLMSTKGAGDYVEDSTFALLLERSELRGRGIPQETKDRYLTLSFVKHREATRDLPPLNLFYDYDKCEFKVL